MFVVPVYISPGIINGGSWKSIYEQRVCRQQAGIAFRSVQAGEARSLSECDQWFIKKVFITSVKIMVETQICFLLQIISPDFICSSLDFSCYWNLFLSVERLILINLRLTIIQIHAQVTLPYRVWIFRVVFPSCDGLIILYVYAPSAVWCHWAKYIKKEGCPVWLFSLYIEKTKMCDYFLKPEQSSLVTFNNNHFILRTFTTLSRIVCRYAIWMILVTKRWNKKRNKKKFHLLSLHTVAPIRRVVI